MPRPRILAALSAMLIAVVAASGCQRDAPSPPPASVQGPGAQPAPPSVAASPAAEPAPVLPPSTPTVAASPAPDVPPVPPAASPVAASPAPQTAPGAVTALPATDLAAGPIYFCEVGGTRMPIEFEPRVEALCRRHPEMGPCQYERNACRKAGGRVYTSKDEEVTLAVEARYDQRVQRVTLQGDGASAKRN